MLLLLPRFLFPPSRYFFIRFCLSVWNENQLLTRGQALPLKYSVHSQHEAEIYISGAVSVPQITSFNEFMFFRNVDRRVLRLQNCEVIGRVFCAVQYHHHKIQFLIRVCVHFSPLIFSGMWHRFKQTNLRTGGDATEHFTILEPRNLSISVSELSKT